MKNKRDQGFILISSILLLAVLSTMLAAYFSITKIETATTKLSKDSATGFYSAEAGLNIRAENIRQRFVGYNRPSGASPTPSNACIGGNLGSGDFACATLASLNNRQVSSYVEEEPSNPIILTIPPGERYQGLNAQEYRYTAKAMSYGIESAREEAILELRFKSRLVPLFQFAAFYNKDLEILPGPAMTLSGPVHTNGDLYLNTDNTLDISGQVTTAGELYRGRKNTNVCNGRPNRIMDPGTARSLVPTCATRVRLLDPDITAWNGMIQRDVPILTVPEPEILDPTSGQVYWEKADLRLVLNVDASGNPVTTSSATGVEVRNTDDSVDAVKTAVIASAAQCPGTIATRAVGTTVTFRNNRENKMIRMLDIDMRALLNCIHNNNLFATGVGPYNSGLKRLDDSSEGGIVFHFTVKGPNSASAANNYGVRVRNSSQLQSNVGGAPLVRGMTVVTDQAMYTMGNFNSTGKIPAAIMSDSFNVLSNNWSNDANSSAALGSRVPTNTTINSALLSGTDTTGNTEGSGGQGGAYNGGLENYPRFHENWNGTVTLTYRGSFVSLNRPRHVSGVWVYGSTHYTAPIRNWNYDVSFNDAANLPPITPRFVYLRQELFVRDFERG